jgi:hypothetical protein
VEEDQQRHIPAAAERPSGVKRMDESILSMMRDDTIVKLVHSSCDGYTGQIKLRNGLVEIEGEQTALNN